MEGVPIRKVSFQRRLVVSGLKKGALPEDDYFSLRCKNARGNACLGGRRAPGLPTAQPAPCWAPISELHTQLTRVLPLPPPDLLYLKVADSSCSKYHLR